MGTARDTDTLIVQQDRCTGVLTTAGDFARYSEYTQDFIRRDHEESLKLQALVSAIQEGLESGVSAKTVPQIMEEVEARLQTDVRLQATPEAGNGQGEIEDRMHGMECTIVQARTDSRRSQ